MLTIHDGKKVNMGGNDVRKRKPIERAQEHLLTCITVTLESNRHFLRKISTETAVISLKITIWSRRPSFFDDTYYTKICLNHLVHHVFQPRAFKPMLHYIYSFLNSV